MKRSDVRWRLRVWAWRLGLLCVVSSVPMCATRQIREDCIRRIHAARTEAEVDAIAAECHRVLEVRR